MVVAIVRWSFGSWDLSMSTICLSNKKSSTIISLHDLFIFLITFSILYISILPLMIICK
jgi:hypothetical protein